MTVLSLNFYLFLEQCTHIKKSQTKKSKLHHFQGHNNHWELSHTLVQCTSSLQGICLPFSVNMFLVFSRPRSHQC